MGFGLKKSMRREGKLEDKLVTSFFSQKRYNGWNYNNNMQGMPSAPDAMSLAPK